MDTHDITQKRSILFSARIRYSPTVQPIRESAIDKIVEQNLLFTEGDKGLTLKEIENQGAVCFPDGTSIITHYDLSKSIERLKASRRIISDAKTGEDRFTLSESALKELSEMQRSAEINFSHVVSKLFSNYGADPGIYAAPFGECLCIIFSTLGEAYVRLIKGEVGLEEFLHMLSVVNALKTIKIKYPAVNHQHLETAIFTFFQESDPEYDAIKWNMAQNYYIAKALGLDPGGHLLSKEVFSNSMFYLDTNVVIPALEPKAQHHKSFEALSKACRRLKIDLGVCQITLNELDRAISYQRSILTKVADQIPEETAPKIRGIFYQLYREKMKAEGSVNLDELFAAFANPMVNLGTSYGVERVDNNWFDIAVSEKETEEFVRAIKEAYLKIRRRTKSRGPALHDALLARWIQKERKDAGRNIWFVTLDTSLPSFQTSSDTGPARTWAITLDALLQWISPITMQENVEVDVAKVFSEAVKYQLLPQERFFDLRDFLVFADMEWSCKELPAKDVEDCIGYIRNKAPGLDPTNSSDREKIVYEINKFFADPSRKYKKEVLRLESEKAQMIEESKRKEEELVRAKSEAEAKVGKLEKEKEDREAEEKERLLKRSAYKRLIWVLIIFIILEVFVIYISNKYGKGDNFVQKVANLWLLPTLAFGLSVGSSWFILGKERIRALGWGFEKLFKK